MMKRLMSRKPVYPSLLCAAALLFASFFTQAQDDARTTRATTLEEIVVTATKKSESIQDIGSSVSAISAADLEGRRVTEFFDYAISIPNLSFGATDDGVLSGRTIALRGVQGENTTGVYIDDTPISETIDPRILDLERIEILRGPTGTLYGARSLGGTIRQITRKPDPTGFDGKVRASISGTEESGDINNLVDLTLNVPLGGNLALILAFLREEKAGVYDRVFGTIADPSGAPATFASNTATTTRKDVDEENTMALRLALLWQPIDSLTIEPRLMSQKTKLSGFPLADQIPDTMGRANQPGGFNQNRNVTVNAPEGGRDEWLLLTFNVSLATQYGVLTSAFSYFDRETFEFEESGAFINWLAINALGTDAANVQMNQLSSPIFQRLESTAYTEELRFASDLGGPVNFVAGLFYQEVSDLEAYKPANKAKGFDDLTGFSFDDLIFTADRPVESKDLGLFADLSINLSDAFTLNLGGRYYDVEIDFLNRQAGLAVGVVLPAGGLAAVDPVTNRTQKDNGFIFKAGVEYAVNDSMLLYTQAVQGFRIAGVNGFVPDTTENRANDTLGCLAAVDAAELTEFNRPTYDSDNLISFETGLKSEIGSHTRINVAAFHIEISDIQQRIPFSCGFPLTANFGDASSDGIEVELITRPTNEITLELNVGYTKAEFEDNIGTLIRSGDALQQVPEFTVSAGFDYFKPHAIGSLDLFFRVDVNYVGKSVTRTNAGDSSAVRERKAYEQVNLRVGVEKDGWSAAFFARNLTDEIANLGDNRSIAAETPGRSRFVVSRPRTVGFDLQYRF